MNDVAIKIESLGKQYYIGRQQRESYQTLRQTLVDVFASPFRRAGKLLRGHATGAANLDESIWALKDISVEIKYGEVVGIIGRNGAGKSTLLKILSRITEPTEGRARIRGRIGSLLEVGTGFHPELTGRENIYLSGAILGMRRTEIDRKFDEIVSFAEVERFIDTPVKHFSSGMYLRLAFAVAAHLEPEILLVDEVLAVGDVSFQKKCLGKMGAVAKEGRTVLFVSHNMGAITGLCTRALWIDQGRLSTSGLPDEVIPKYLASTSPNNSVWVNESNNELGSKARLRSVRVLDSANKPTPTVKFKEVFKIEIAYDVFEATQRFAILCRLTNIQGELLWTSWDVDTTEWGERLREPGGYSSVCKVPGSLLKPGPYLISVGTLTPRSKFISYYEHVLSFDISAIGYPLNLNRGGVITPLLEWEVKRCDQEKKMARLIA